MVDPRVALRYAGSIWGRHAQLLNPLTTSQHLDRLFVTNDAATILRELEVVHPAAKVLVMASQQQEAEVSADKGALPRKILPCLVSHTESSFSDHVLAWV